ncbi:MFS transporter [Streptomyces sp. NPDC057555]|uniref:MFS transporter n=1 Tax=Streptomyces sp. NPDC057555 TaxID=3346166 RepID=UPI003698475C
MDHCPLGHPATATHPPSSAPNGHENEQEIRRTPRIQQLPQLAQFPQITAESPAPFATRALQGLSAAALMPQPMTLIIGTFPAERRGAALGVWAGVADVATIAGPTLGGLLVSTAGSVIALGALSPASWYAPPDLRPTPKPPHTGLIG